MRALWLVMAVAPLFVGCPCPKAPTPFPPRVGFAVPEGHPIVAALQQEQAAIVANPRVAKLEDVCSEAFNTLIAGRYCTPRVKACCDGVGCLSVDAAAACTVQRKPELGRTCCGEAAPAFFANVPACAGMAVQGCKIVPTPQGPKPIP